MLCQTLPAHSEVGGRRDSGAHPSSWAGPWSKTGLNLLGHQACWDWGQREDNPDLLIKPSKWGSQARCPNSTPRSFVFSELGSLNLCWVVPLSLERPPPYLGKGSFSFGALFREHLLQEALLTPGLPTNQMGSSDAHGRNAQHCPSMAGLTDTSRTSRGLGKWAQQGLSRISCPKTTLVVEEELPAQIIDQDSHHRPTR